MVGKSSTYCLPVTSHFLYNLRFSWHIFQRPSSFIFMLNKQKSAFHFLEEKAFQKIIWDQILYKKVGREVVFLILGKIQLQIIHLFTRRFQFLVLSVRPASVEDKIDLTNVRASYLSIASCTRDCTLLTNMWGYPKKLLHHHLPQQMGHPNNPLYILVSFGGKSVGTFLNHLFFLRKIVREERISLLGSTKF